MDDSVCQLIQIIGQNVRRERGNRNMSQSDLAKLSGVSRSTIYKIENGQSIELDNLIKIAQALGIETDTLFLSPDQIASYTAKARIFWDTFMAHFGNNPGGDALLKPIRPEANHKRKGHS